MSAFPPAERCVVCEGTHLPGRRIIAGHRGGVLLLAPGVHPPSDHSSRLVATPDGPMLLATHGPCWTDEALARAERDAAAGRHPWLCQRCLHFVCRSCGGLWDRPIMHDMIEEDGSKTHAGFLGGAPRCRECGGITGSLPRTPRSTGGLRTSSHPRAPRQKKMLLLCSRTFLEYIPRDRDIMACAARIRSFTTDFCDIGEAKMVKNELDAEEVIEWRYRDASPATGV